LEKALKTESEQDKELINVFLPIESLGKSQMHRGEDLKNLLEKKGFQIDQK
jgi:hypothetical protein